METATKISIVNSLLVFSLVTIVFFDGFRMPMLFSYQIHKLLHLLGIMLFMGNMLVGPVWFILAINTKNLAIAKFSVRLLGITDVAFTVFGVDLAVWNGLSMASRFGALQTQEWLQYSILLLFLMWIMMVPVIYFQEKIYTRIEKSDFESMNMKMSVRNWIIWGICISIPPSLIFYLMVCKSW